MKSRIQIIDDNVALTTLLAKALAKFGYEPVVENNPLLAVNTVRHYMPDLILLDVMMPKMMGFDVCRALRAEGDNVTFGFVTSEGSDAMRQQAADSGALFLIAKPFTADMFAEALKPVFG